jgi:hypothetical protein
MKWLRGVAGFVAVLALVGCTKGGPKPDTPEGALHSYVVTAFEARSVADKQKLIELSTGEAKAYLEQMGEADFKRQFLDSKLQFVSMKARDLREQTGGDVSLVYDLNYKDTRDGGVTHCKIKFNKNMKTFVERKEDLVITPDITDQQPAPAKGQ